jgi:hypothetical protein
MFRYTYARKERKRVSSEDKIQKGFKKLFGTNQLKLRACSTVDQLVMFEMLAGTCDAGPPFLPSSPPSAPV